jgi:tetratricopeptide (TPR) repeat protein
MDVQEQLRRDKVRSLLSAAALSNRRLQWDEALQKCQEALALDSQNGEAHELIGDILQAMGNWNGSLQAYQSAQKLNPHRTVLEEKIGLVSIELDQMTLREERRQQLAADPTQLKWDERDPRVACIFSGILPGLGQFYNGEVVKAVILLGATLLSLGVLAFLLHGAVSAGLSPPTISGKLDAMMKHMQGWSIPKLLWALLNCFIPLGVWIYSVIEAPLRAKQMNRAMRAELGIE